MSDRTLKPALTALSRGLNLSEEEAREAMSLVMEGAVPPTHMAGFLMGLRGKGETVDEIVGCARAIRARSAPFPGARPGLLDTCGTGGDGAGTFNISTTAAFVVAGADVAVAKHGNRGISSATGSADVLEALGVEVTMDGNEGTAALDAAGITFLFAPVFHAAMRHAAPVRRELGVRTVFNLLGPLCNPAGATAQILGVFDADMVRPVAEALGRLGAARAMVVHGADGLDEITVTGPTRVSEWTGSEVRDWTVDPEALGLPLRDAADMRGGTAVENAAITRGVLSGEATGAPRDVVLLNAAAALVVSGRAGDLREGLEEARRSIASGAALARLELLASFSQTVRQRRLTRRVEPAVPAMPTGWGVL